MKKILSLFKRNSTALILAAVLFVGMSVTWKNWNVVYDSGYKLVWSLGTPLTANSYYNYPSLAVDSFAYADTMAIEIGTLETHVKCNSMTGNSVLSITAGSGVYPGCKLYTKFICSDTTTRTVYVDVNNTRVDTITCNTKVKKDQFVFLNHRFEKL